MALVRKAMETGVGSRPQSARGRISDKEESVTEDSESGTEGETEEGETEEEEEEGEAGSAEKDKEKVKMT